MIHNQATVEDVIRMAYNTPTYTYGYKLAASDVLARLHPDVLRADAPAVPGAPDLSQAEQGRGCTWNRWTPPSSSAPSCCS